MSITTELGLGYMSNWEILNKIPVGIFLFFLCISYINKVSSMWFFFKNSGVCESENICYDPIDLAKNFDLFRFT